MFFGPKGYWELKFDVPVLRWFLKTNHSKNKNDPTWETDYNYYEKVCQKLDKIQTRYGQETYKRQDTDKRQTRDIQETYKTRDRQETDNRQDRQKTDRKQTGDRQQTDRQIAYKLSITFLCRN